MRIFKNKWFSKFADKQGIITDADLIEAIQAANDGSIDADLGGGVIKQRIARKGKGKRGGYRSIICFRYEERAFFVYGFAKSDRANISAGELRDLKRVAAGLLSATDRQLQGMKDNNEITEINHDL